MLSLADAMRHVDAPDRDVARSLLGRAPAHVWQEMRLRQLSPGQALLRSGDAVEAVYVHLSGQLWGEDVDTTGNVYRFIQLRPVNIIGEFEAFTRTPSYIVTIQAATSVVALSLDIVAFERWMREDNASLYQVCTLMARKLSHEPKANRQYLFMRAPQRLMHYLIEGCAGEAGDDGSGAFVIRKTHAEIAEEVGFSIKTIDRGLAELEREGLVTPGHGHVVVSAAQLRDMRGRVRGGDR